MKVGDIVRTIHNEKCYVVEVHEKSETVVLFSAEWGKYQPMVHKFTDVTLEENSKLLNDNTR